MTSPVDPNRHVHQPSYPSPGMKGESDDTKTVSHEALQHTVGNTRVFQSSQRPHDWDIEDKENHPKTNNVRQQVLGG
ncbi:MAG: hypothetical protein KDK76_02850 [Chlamydiia bacterium]|nr:hypothetical protein [Chlamydiia bacterium]